MRLLVILVMALAVMAVSPLFSDENGRVVARNESPQKIDPSRIAELVEELESERFWESDQCLSEIRRLLRDNQGSESEFVPLVKPLLRRSGGGGIGRRCSELAEATIVAIGLPSRPFLIQRLTSEDARERRVAVQVLFKINPTDSNLVILMRPLLIDKDVFVRGAALNGFRSIGPRAMDAIADLEQVAASDSFHPWRVRASEALIYVEGASKERIQDLAAFALLDEPCDYANLRAIDAIAQLGEKARFLEPMLIAALQHADVRGSAVAALGAIGATSPESVTSLTEILTNDSSHEIRRTAAAALGELGPRSKQAIPALRSALAELGSEGGWYLVPDSLSKIGGPEVVPILMESLVHPDADVRLASIDGLGRLGRLATPAIAALESASQDDERPLNRPHAVKALESIRKASLEK